MPAIVKYFSAEIAHPTLREPRQRIRIRNRATPNTFTDHSWKIELGDSVDAQLRQLYHSPILRVETLWYDPRLELFFFRTVESPYAQANI